jgi:hypothetical protein
MKKRKPGRKEIRSAFGAGLDAWNERARLIRAGKLPPPAKSLREAFDRIRARRRRP